MAEARPTTRGSSTLFSTLALALLVIGCDSASPTLAPQTAAAPTPSVAPTVTPTDTAAPTVVPTPQPTVDCATAGSEPGFDLETPVGLETVDLEDGPLESPTVVDPSDVPIVSALVGNIEQHADLAVGDGLDASTEISEVDADFVPFGTASPLPVNATASGSSVSMRLPDKRVDGQLRVQLTWTTECGSGSGSATIALSVFPASVAAGCPQTPDHLEDALVPLKNAHVTFDALSVPLTVVDWSGRWIAGSGAVDAPQFAGWDDAHSVAAAPAGLIVLRESIADLSLVSIVVATYRRADVVDYLAGGATGNLEYLTYTRRPAGPLGRASIPAPLDPGRYVVDVTGTWLTSCLNLETHTVVSVQVR